MNKAEKYYNETKHKDTWGVDVVYPTFVKNMIEISNLEGILIGLNIAKELWAQGTISHEELTSEEEHYQKMLDELTVDPEKNYMK